MTVPNRVARAIAGDWAVVGHPIRWLKPIEVPETTGAVSIVNCLRHVVPRTLDDGMQPMFLPHAVVPVPEFLLLDRELSPISIATLVLVDINLSCRWRHLSLDAKIMTGVTIHVRDHPESYGINREKNGDTGRDEQEGHCDVADITVLA